MITAQPTPLLLDLSLIHIYFLVVPDDEERMFVHDKFMERLLGDTEEDDLSEE